MILLLALLGCRDKDAPVDSAAAPPAWAVAESLGPIDAFATDGATRLYSVGEALYTAPDTPLSRAGLPDGATPFLSALDGELLASVHGQGLFRYADDHWVDANEGFDNPLLGVLNADARPVPIASALGEDGTTWLAAAGGVFASEGEGWRLAPTATSGATNLVFTDIAVSGDLVVATAVLPSSIIPTDFAGLLSGTVFLSDDGGEGWEDLSDDLPSLYASAVAIDGDRVLVGTLDVGTWAWEDGAWSEVEGGPSDVVSLQVEDGALLVGSASRGLWQQRPEGWAAVGDGAVRGAGPGLVALVDGTLLAPDPDASPTPAPASAGGQVHIALSFHGNYYHSYRGDTPTDDGFGLDIDVITNTLDWLDAHPGVHGDWDFDNAFTTDDWMPEYSPELLQRISARVAAGQDDVRLMAWNNGAMASMTEEEFTLAIERAKTSNEAAFGAWVPGVQPQENMFTPAHVRWYTDLGVEWITLFYAANSFTGPRLDVTLEGSALYNPVEISAPEGGATMDWVPVYHHADMIEHGGLKGWARQLHDRFAEDTLLVIHFDADGESWENFGAELDSVEGLDFITWTTIQDYLDEHEAVDAVVLEGEQADGTGDGFQSWAEKDWNHQLWTEVMAARRAHALAALLGVDRSTPQWTEALEWRLLAMSTTNYGLAMPTLHPDRVASGAAQAQEARRLAESMLADALGEPLAPGELRVLNARPVGGPALLSTTLSVPGFVEGQGRLFVTDAEGGEHEVEVLAVEESGTQPLVELAWVAEVEPESDSRWSWSYDPDGASADEAPAAPELAWLEAPFFDCEGERTTLAELDGRALRGAISASNEQPWSGEVCGQSAYVRRTLTAWAGLDGVVVDVQASVPAVGLDGGLESVALSPLRCGQEADSLTWLSHSGDRRERPARGPVASWNGQSADGWAELGCGAEALSISHDTTLRTSMAFLPVANQGGEAWAFPLGTVWGPSPWHDGRRTGGHGLGEIVVPVVGSQFAPAAPDWAGQDVHYRLLIGEELSPELMELFAHPPYVIGG